MLPKEAVAAQIGKPSATPARYTDKLIIETSTNIDWAITGLSNHDSPITMIVFGRCDLESVKKVLPKMGPKVTWIKLTKTSADVTEYIMKFIQSNMNSIDGIEFDQLTDEGITVALRNLVGDRSAFHWIEFSGLTSWSKDNNALFAVAKDVDKIGMSKCASEHLELMFSGFPDSVKEIRIYDTNARDCILNFLKRHKKIANVQKIEVAISCARDKVDLQLREMKSLIDKDCKVGIVIPEYMVVTPGNPPNSSPASSIITAPTPSLAHVKAALKQTGQTAFSKPVPKNVIPPNPFIASTSVLSASASVNHTASFSSEHAKTVSQLTGQSTAAKPVTKNVLPAPVVATTPVLPASLVASKTASSTLFSAAKSIPNQRIVVNLTLEDQLNELQKLMAKDREDFEKRMFEKEQRIGEIRVQINTLKRKAQEQSSVASSGDTSVTVDNLTVTAVAKLPEQESKKPRVEPTRSVSISLDSQNKGIADDLTDEEKGEIRQIKSFPHI